MDGNTPIDNLEGSVIKVLDYEVKDATIDTLPVKYINLGDELVTNYVTRYELEKQGYHCVINYSPLGAIDMETIPLRKLLIINESNPLSPDVQVLCIIRTRGLEVYSKIKIQAKKEA